MEEKKKANKRLIITIVILTTLVLGLGGYIVYDKFYAKKETPKEVTYKQLTEEEVEALNDSLIMRTSSEDDNTLKGADLFIDKANIDTITSDQIMLYILIKYCLDEGIEMDYDKLDYAYAPDYDELGENENVENAQKYFWKVDRALGNNVKASSEDVPSISKDVIDNLIKETFNTEKVFDITKDTDYYNGDGLGIIRYVKADNKFYVVQIPFMGEYYHRFENVEMIDYKQDKDTLYVYDKLFNCFNGATGQGNLSCCSRNGDFVEQQDEMVCNKKGVENANFKIDEKIVNENLKFDFNYLNKTHSSMFDTYKVIFKSDANGNYYWVSSEISNE